MVLQLLNELSKFGDVYIVGGFLSDLLFKQQFRNIDIIFSKDVTRIKHILHRYEYERNRLGGYQLYIQNIEVDIWGFKDDWAYKQGFTKECSLQEIAKERFLNIDSIVYCYNTGIYYDNYFNNSYINFVNKDLEYINSNPDRNVNCAKILHKQYKYNMELSKDTIDYLLSVNSNDIYNGMIKHYKTEVLSREYIDKTLDNLKMKIS